MLSLGGRRCAVSNVGKNFEQNFKDSVPKDVYYLRLHDSAIGFDTANSTQRFALKSPFDCMLYKLPVLYALELKSTSGKSVSYRGTSPMIKSHQIQKLREAACKGIKAGFIFNFRQSNRTYFLSVGDFDGLTDHQMRTKSSISELEIINSGRAILIPQTLKKVNWKYDLDVLFNRGQLTI